MVILKKTKILTGIGIVILLLISFGVYGLYKAKDFLAGSDIIMKSPKNGQRVSRAYNTIKGKVVNVSSLRVNGRRIFADEEGNFETNLLLAAGYNIIEVQASDKFNRKVKKIIEVVY